jgi:molybdopterin converting factor small subunit
VLRDRAGVGEIVLDVASGSTVAAAVENLRARVPGVGDAALRAAFAVNREYVTGEAVLNDGDELALIPPVSGGSS